MKMYHSLNMLSINLLFCNYVSVYIPVHFYVLLILKLILQLQNKEPQPCSSMNANQEGNADVLFDDILTSLSLEESISNDLNNLALEQQVLINVSFQLDYMLDVYNIYRFENANNNVFPFEIKLNLFLTEVLNMQQISKEFS